jgi:hypothetical protein
MPGPGSEVARLSLASVSAPARRIVTRGTTLHYITLERMRRLKPRPAEGS